MGKKREVEESVTPEPMMQLVNAFRQTYRPVSEEVMADELFTMRKLREYFGAWPQPKQADPLAGYLDELECLGFRMSTGYDGTPTLFCQFRKGRGGFADTEELPSEEVADYSEQVNPFVTLGERTDETEQPVKAPFDDPPY